MEVCMSLSLPVRSILLLALAALVAAAPGDEQKIPLGDVPKVVLDAVRAEFPAAELKETVKETEEGKTTYEVSLEDKGADVDVAVSADGKIVEVERALDQEVLPKAVKEAIEAKYPKATAKKAEERTQFDDGKEDKSYEVQILTADGKSVALTVDEDGEVEDEGGDEFTSDFAAEKPDLTSTGRNPYFSLEPGYQLVLERGKTRLTITVLGQTRVVDGVEARVVDERETEGDEVVEVSRNFLAISRRTNSVYYFGEEVDEYKGGKVVSHGGAWLAGQDGAKFGLLMPGQPLLRARYYQEVAPGKAMDRAEVVGLGEVVRTPAGEFRGCLKTEETNPLKPGEKEYKLYAPGVGLVREESLTLVRHGKVALENK
jgi:hypothetical protein